MRERVVRLSAVQRGQRSGTAASRGSGAACPAAGYSGRPGGRVRGRGRGRPGAFSLCINTTWAPPPARPGPQTPPPATPVLPCPPRPTRAASPALWSPHPRTEPNPTPSSLLASPERPPCFPWPVHFNLDRCPTHAVVFTEPSPSIPSGRVTSSLCFLLKAFWGHIPPTQPFPACYFCDLLGVFLLQTWTNAATLSPRSVSVLVLSSPSRPAFTLQN